jgi:hypothetical protein
VWECGSVGVWECGSVGVWDHLLLNFELTTNSLDPFL